MSCEHTEVEQTADIDHTCLACLREQLAAAEAMTEKQKERAEAFLSDWNSALSEVARLKRSWQDSRDAYLDTKEQLAAAEKALGDTRVKMHESVAALDFATNGEGRQLTDALHLLAAAERERAEAMAAAGRAGERAGHWNVRFEAAERERDEHEAAKFRWISRAAEADHRAEKAEKELADVSDRLATLDQAFDLQARDRDRLAAENAHLRIKASDLESASERVNELAAENAALKSDNELRRRDFAEMNAQLTARDAEIARLTAAIKAIDALIESTHGHMSFAELWAVMVEQACEITDAALAPKGAEAKPEKAPLTDAERRRFEVMAKFRRHTAAESREYVALLSRWTPPAAAEAKPDVCACGSRLNANGHCPWTGCPQCPSPDCTAARDPVKPTPVHKDHAPAAAEAKPVGSGPAILERYQIAGGKAFAAAEAKPVPACHHETGSGYCAAAGYAQERPGGRWLCRVHYEETRECDGTCLLYFNHRCPRHGGGR